jgi:hypothetical protein
MIGFYVIKQYERGAQFRLGRVKEGPRGPGVMFVIPLVDRVSLRIVTMPIEAQGIITRDKRLEHTLGDAGCVAAAGSDEGPGRTTTPWSVRSRCSATWWWSTCRPEPTLAPEG